MSRPLAAADYNPLQAAMAAMLGIMADMANKAVKKSVPKPKGGATSKGEPDDLRLLYRSMPGAAPRSEQSKTQLIDGVWLGQRGEYFMIRDGYFRLFVSGFSQFENGRIDLKGPMMRIKSGRTERIANYIYAYKDGRMILKGEGGDLLLYKRVPLEYKKDFSIRY
jgi:hypothetical protein